MVLNYYFHTLSKPNLFYRSCRNAVSFFLFSFLFFLSLFILRKTETSQAGERQREGGREREKEREGGRKEGKKEEKKEGRKKEGKKERSKARREDGKE